MFNILRSTKNLCHRGGITTTAIRTAAGYGPMYEASVKLVGKVVQEPYIIETASGVKMAKIRLSTTTYQSPERPEMTSYHNVVTFFQRFVKMAETIQIGDRVVVIGNIQNRIVTDRNNPEKRLKLCQIQPDHLSVVNEPATEG